MGDNSGIEWTDATWNPVVGCSIVSPGCTNCYAMKWAHLRLDGSAQAPHYSGTTEASKSGGVWTGKVASAPLHIWQMPLRWKKPRRIFVNSMGDLFHEDVPDHWIDDAFAVMALAPHHTFQVLTKRAKRMRDYFADPERVQLIANAIASKSVDAAGLLRLPLPNVWLGVSTEDQRRADERVPDLLATPAAVRFVSAEPLLGPIVLSTAWTRQGDNGSYPQSVQPHTGLDWVIVGGESGPGARPMKPDWARSIRDQCAAASVAFHFKQWGEWVSVSEVEGDGAHHRFEDGATVRRVGKKRAGRTLDGREHNDMPGRA